MMSQYLITTTYKKARTKLGWYNICTERQRQNQTRQEKKPKCDSACRDVQEICGHVLGQVRSLHVDIDRFDSYQRGQ